MLISLNSSAGGQRWLPPGVSPAFNGADNRPPCSPYRSETRRQELAAPPREAVYREATHEKWKTHIGCWCACVYCDAQYKRVCGTWNGINNKNERQRSPCWHLIILGFSPLLHSPLAFPLLTSPLCTCPYLFPLSPSPYLLSLSPYLLSLSPSPYLLSLSPSPYLSLFTYP